MAGSGHDSQVVTAAAVCCSRCWHKILHACVCVLLQGYGLQCTYFRQYTRGFSHVHQGSFAAELFGASICCRLTNLCAAWVGGRTSSTWCRIDRVRLYLFGRCAEDRMLVGLGGLDVAGVCSWGIVCVLALIYAIRTPYLVGRIERVGGNGGARHPSAVELFLVFHFPARKI